MDKFAKKAAKDEDLQEDYEEAQGVFEDLKSAYADCKAGDEDACDAFFELAEELMDLVPKLKFSDFRVQDKFMGFEFGDAHQVFGNEMANFMGFEQGGNQGGPMGGPQMGPQGGSFGGSQGGSFGGSQGGFGGGF